VLNLVGITTANPNNPYGENVIYAGRTFGSTAPVQYGHRESNTYRGVISLQGELFGYWGYDTALQYSENHYDIRNSDAVRDNFETALNSNVYGDYWNPFVANTYEANKDLIPYVFSDLQIDRKATLLTWDFSANTVLGALDSRPVMFATGLQYRKEGLEQQVDDVYANYGYGFTLGGSEFDEDRDVVAVFSELEIPVLDVVSANLALRYEDYGSDGGDELSPRISIAYHPSASFNIMAAASTAFRQPSLAQVAGDTMVTLAEVTADGGNSYNFTAVKPNANPDLKSEESTAFSVNVFYRPLEQLTFNIDFWRYEIEDIIVAENAQALVDAGDPAVTYRLPGLVEYIDVTFINAGEVTTDGVDLNITYMQDLSQAGALLVKTGATYINSYDLTAESGKTTDVSGSRNFNTFARPLPKTRVNLLLQWQLSAHEVSLYGYYIDSYENDQIVINGSKAVDTVASTDVWNLQYAYNGGKQNDQWQLRIGVNNLFDEEPPYIPTNLGYDTKMHDARGRMFYLGGQYDF
jgi:outer membrane receptor protein involved in Fe transport